MRVKLKDITKFSKGTQINGKNLIDDGAYSYLNGGINPSGKWNEFNVAENTVTISEGGNSSGYVNYMSKAFWCGAHCYYLYDGPKNSKYLYYALKSQQERLFRIRSGACMPNIKKSDLGNFIIEYEEDETRQEEVVKVLEKCELLIEDYNKKLALLDEAVRARFVEMFGDPIQNSKGYPIRQFSDYIISLTSGSRGWAKYCVNDGKEWFITIKNVKDCNIITDNIQPINAPSNAEAKRTKVEEGDLLISITADLGRTGVVTKEVAEHGAYINQHLSCIRIDREILNPLYVAYYMESSAGKRQFIQKNQSAVKAGLNFNSINSLKLLVPPMGEQNKFIRFVKQIDKSRSRIQKSLEASQELFDSLMQEYFG